MIYKAQGVGRASGPGSVLDHSLRETSNLQRSGDWRVERILHFVDAQDGKFGWDLNQLCKQLELGISASHAAKLFNRHTGIGIREYIKQRRLTLAAQQIQSTTDSVKRIALELGYRTPNDLRRQFKKQFCLTPTEFRQQTARQLSPHQLSPQMFLQM
jgi:AraC-like DNA-binding protein